MRKLAEKHPDETKEKILFVARELFAERGFRDTTIREIAAKARVNIAAINYYFKSKNALYEAIFIPSFETVWKPLADLPSTVTDQASWQAALEKWFGFVLELFLLDTPERSVFRRLVAQERAAPSALTTRVCSDVILPVTGIFKSLLRMALPDADAPTFHAAYIVAMGQCACFMHRDGPWEELEICPSVSREEWVRRLRDEMVANVVARYSWQAPRPV